jgi:hypothetical protein
MEHDRARGGFQGFWIGVGSGGERRKAPTSGEETSMRIRTILLVGAGVLAMCIGPAGAKSRSDRAEFRASSAHHYVRHSHRSMARYSRVRHERIGATSGSQSSDLMVAGNNPAKKYSERQLDERAVKTGTLYQAGNNPAKRYKAVETTGASNGRTR